jgi:hypothetical protein
MLWAPTLSSWTSRLARRRCCWREKRTRSRSRLQPSGRTVMRLSTSGRIDVRKFRCQGRRSRSSTAALSRSIRTATTSPGCSMTLVIQARRRTDHMSHSLARLTWGRASLCIPLTMDPMLSSFRRVSSWRWRARAIRRTVSRSLSSLVALDSPQGGTPGLIGWFQPRVAFAHGFPWEAWLVYADGSNLHQIQDVIDDDPSVTWSPDASPRFDPWRLGKLYRRCLERRRRAADLHCRLWLGRLAAGLSPKHRRGGVDMASHLLKRARIGPASNQNALRLVSHNAYRADT